MGSVYFVGTEFFFNGGYRSYVDLFDLIRLSNYPIIHLSDIDPQSDNTYIFTPANAESIKGWPDAKAQIILWQLEWMLTDEHNTPPGVKRVWASDKSFAEKQGFEYVPVGSHYLLNQAMSRAPKVSDVALLSYQTPRRQLITQELSALHLTIEQPEGWEPTLYRSEMLMRSRAMVHVHQHDNIRTVAPLRWALAAAHKLPIISETVDDRGIFGYTHMMTADYTHISSFVRAMVKNEDLLADYALALHGLLCRDYTFRKVIEKNV